MNNIEPGFYTLVYQNGAYRTIRFKQGKERFADKVIVSYREGKHYTGFGFLEPGGHIRFWRSFRLSNTPERLRYIQNAVYRIAQDPQAHALAFAMQDGCCARCARQLTVPASLFRGLGPECAKAGKWSKKDQEEVFRCLQKSALEQTAEQSKMAVSSAMGANERGTLSTSSPG